jgi:hypothetical protein
MTDRQLLIRFGKSLAAFASLAVLCLTGAAWSEATYVQTTRTVDVQYVR